MPHVSHSQAGGKLTMGFWDHWVPGGNNASTELCQEWGAKNKVEVRSTTSPRKATRTS